MALLAMQLGAADRAASNPDGALVNGEMHRALGILNYFIGDYPLAVSVDGEILNDFEHREQITLLQQLGAILSDADTRDASAEVAVSSLRRDAGKLHQLVEAQRGSEEVLDLARSLRKALVDTYDLDLAPPQLPSLARGRELYGRACVACHGTAGRARTPVADLLDPRPTNLLSRHLDQTLSPYQTFNVVTYGVDGTAMPAFAALSVMERWDVAFYVMAMRQRAIPRGSRSRGDPPLDVLARSTDAELATWLGMRGVPANRRASEIARLRRTSGDERGD